MLLVKDLLDAEIAADVTGVLRLDALPGAPRSEQLDACDGLASRLVHILYNSGMDDLILTRLNVTEPQIAAFCRKWKIVRFELFGSALREDFDAESDVDVLVTFEDGGTRRISDYLDMEDELVALFGRPVDLVERRLVESSPNWIRRRHILSTAQPVYAI